MVKNDGGNKGKGLARKHVNAAKCGGSKLLRVATDEAERYAVVSKMLGNGMCYVRLLNGGSGGSGDKLCIIRNKFKGRGKRDNILDSGSWVLIGMREWASKQDTCDLLEVYNYGERDRLMKNEPCFKSVAVESEADITSSVQFADSATLKYNKLVNDKGNANAKDSGDSGDSDSDGLYQRAYDMPSDDDSDDSEPDAPLNAPPLNAPPLNAPPLNAALNAVAPLNAPLNAALNAALNAVAPLKPLKPLKLKVDHINVDDI
jgi:hypothetical protein